MLVACSGGTGERARADGGAVPDAGIATDIPEPMPPLLTPCPDGWREVTLAGTELVACDPWPESGAVECGDGEAHFPGEPGCATVGPACPAGDFIETLPDGRVGIFVAGTPGTGGSGTRDDPFHDLGDAFAAATGTEVFVLGKGTHTIVGIFPESSTFIGACAAETHLVAGFDNEFTGVISAAEGAELEVRNVHVRGPTPGLLAIEASRITAENVIIDGTGIAGIWAQDGSTITVRNVLVRDTAGSPSMGFGRAAVAQTGGRVEVTRGAFERTREIAAFAVDVGSALVLEDVAIRDTLPQHTDDGFGRAVEIAMGATGTLRRVALERNLGYGVFTGGAGARVDIEDAVVRGHRSQVSDGEAGRGLSAQEGAQLTASRVLVDDNRELGVYGAGVGGSVTLRDVIVRGTRPRDAMNVGGRGVQVQWGGALDAERVVVDDNQDFGVFLFEATARLADVTVSRTAEDATTGEHGRGVEALEGTTLELVRVAIDDNRDVGLYLQGEGTTATVDALRVSRMRPEAVSDFYGRGVNVASGASLTGTRVRVLDNRESGLIAYGTATVSLSDVHIERTAHQACAETTCSDTRVGIGLVVVDEARVELADFTIADNALAGMFLEAVGSVTLTGGEIARHPIGVHVGAGEAGFETAFRDVAFVENARNVDATVLPLPDTSSPGSADL